MKHVLLAINGDIPTNSTFQYAVGLCKRIRADLNILQFIKAKKMAECIASTKIKVGSFSKFIEDSFAGIAFAEEGMPEVTTEILSGISYPLKKLLQSDTRGVLYTVSLSDGAPEIELTAYIENHKDILLTIFDPSNGLKRHGRREHIMMKALRKKLCVPLVVVKI